MRVCICILMFMCVYVPPYVHTHPCTYMHAYTCMKMCMPCIHSVCVYIYTHTKITYLNGGWK